jgi:hypothetical protein
MNTESDFTVCFASLRPPLVLLLMSVCLVPAKTINEINVYKSEYWIMRWSGDEPFVEKDDYYGKIYRVGDAAEMLELLRRKGDLAWTAHPRIKVSTG